MQIVYPKRFAMRNVYPERFAMQIVYPKRFAMRNVYPERFAMQIVYQIVYLSPYEVPMSECNADECRGK
jgi:hypothetical protein